MQPSTNSLPSPSASARLSLALFFFLLTLLSYGIVAPRMLNDPDAAWHIAAGDLIRQLGHLPAHDPWSYTAGGTQWIHGAWLWDVLVSWLHEQGGLALVLHFHLLLAGCTMALLVLACLDRGAGILTTLLVCFVVLILFKPFIAVRSHNFTYFFLVLFQLLLHRWHIGKAGISIWWLVPLITWWANFHGLFMAGFMLLGMYGVAALLARQWRKFGQLTMVGLACIAGVSSTPLGIDVFYHVLLNQRSVMLSYIGEWQSFSLQGAYAHFVFYMLACVWFTRPRQLADLRDSARLPDWGVQYFWLVQSLVHVRHLSVFLLMTAPILAEAMQRALVLNTNKWMIALAGREQVWRETLASRRIVRSMPGLAVAAMLLVMSGYATRWQFPHGVAFPPVYAPTEAAAFILREYPHQRFMTHYNFGGYLIYATRGGIPIFVDGRCEVAYPPATLRDYLTFDLLQPGWQEVLQRWHIDGALLPPSPVYDEALASIGWRKVFSSASADVFVKQ